MKTRMKNEQENELRFDQVFRTTMTAIIVSHETDAKHPMRCSSF